MDKLYVIGAKHFDFEKDGKRITGNKLYYLKDNNSDNSIGQVMDSISIDEAFIRKLTVLPGWYNVKFDFELGYKGQAKIKLIGLEVAKNE